jgi:hypothetical protein
VIRTTILEKVINESSTLFILLVYKLSLNMDAKELLKFEAAVFIFASTKSSSLWV